MSGTRVEVLIDSGVFERVTGYGLDRTYRVVVDGIVTTKIRVRVHRDSHDPQSVFTAHVWRPDGWTLVAEIDGQHPDVANMPQATKVLMHRHDQSAHEECVAAAERVAKRLLNDALLVLL